MTNRTIFALLTVSALVQGLGASSSRQAYRRTDNLPLPSEQDRRSLGEYSEDDNLFYRGKGKSSYSSKSSKSGKGKGGGKGRSKAYNRHTREPPRRPTPPPILDLVHKYQNLRRATMAPAFAPDEPFVPPPIPVPTVAKNISPTPVPTFAPTLPRKTVTPTKTFLSNPPTWDDTPMPTSRMLGRSYYNNNMFSAKQAKQTRQSTLLCKLNQGGLYGSPLSTSKVYPVEFLYQIYVAFGTTEAVIRSRVLPKLDTVVTEKILPAFFDCGAGRRLQQQEGGTIDAISSRQPDEIIFSGLECSGEPRQGSDCYVVKGYISVMASGYRSSQALENYVLPEIQNILQTTSWSDLIPELTGTENLNDDLTPMNPPPPTTPIPTSPPGVDTSGTPTTATRPPVSQPSPSTPVTPQPPTDEPAISSRGTGDDSFIDKMDWWGWLLLIGGGALIFFLVIAALTSKRTSPRPAGQPARSDDDLDVEDNSGAYNPPAASDPYQNMKSSPAAAAAAAHDNSIGRFQVTHDTLQADDTAGRVGIAPPPAAPVTDESSQEESYQESYQEIYQNDGVNYASQSDMYENAPSSQELGQLGMVEEDASYDHARNYQPPPQPAQMLHDPHQIHEQQQGSEAEISEYEEYVDEEYVESHGDEQEYVVQNEQGQYAGQQDGSEYTDGVEYTDGAEYTEGASYEEVVEHDEEDETYESYEEEVVE